MNKGAKPETKRLVAKMSVSGSGIRDISRVPEISKDTAKLTNVNPKYINLEEPLAVRIEMDEMWGKSLLKNILCRL